MTSDRDVPRRRHTRGACHGRRRRTDRRSRRCVRQALRHGRHRPGGHRLLEQAQMSGAQPGPGPSRLRAPRALVPVLRIPSDEPRTRGHRHRRVLRKPRIAFGEAAPAERRALRRHHALVRTPIAQARTGHHRLPLVGDERRELRDRLRAQVAPVTGPHRHGSGLGLPVADDREVRHLLKLAVTDATPHRL